MVHTGGKGPTFTVNSRLDLVNHIYYTRKSPSVTSFFPLPSVEKTAPPEHSFGYLYKPSSPAAVFRVFSPVDGVR